MEPPGELDPRFSDPHAQPMPWSTVDGVMSGAMTYMLGTVRQSGRPHATPVAGAWRDGSFFFCTGADEQKARNLEANPRVVVSAGSSAWEGNDVVVEGTAIRVLRQPLLAELAEGWNRKYGDVFGFRADPEGFRGGEGNVALVFEVRPRKVLGFAKLPTFGQTTFRF